MNGAHWVIVFAVGFLVFKAAWVFGGLVIRRRREKKEREAQDEQERTKPERKLGYTTKLMDGIEGLYFMVEERKSIDENGYEDIIEFGGLKNINMFSGRWYVHEDVLHLEICDKEVHTEKKESRDEAGGQWIRCDEITFHEINKKWLTENEIIEVNECGN